MNWKIVEQRIKGFGKLIGGKFEDELKIMQFTFFFFFTSTIKKSLGVTLGYVMVNEGHDCDVLQV